MDERNNSETDSAQPQDRTLTISEHGRSMAAEPTGFESAEHDLFSRLAPSGAEDFVTEALCWLLERTQFGDYFLNKLRGSEDAVTVPSIGDDCYWKTQESFNLDGSTKIPDMICKSSDGRAALIFEHKVGATLHDGQLDNYRRIGQAEFKEHAIVLITARAEQCDQDPDLHLLWRTVHGWLCQWLESGTNTIDTFVARSFLQLLEDRGLAAMLHEWCEVGEFLLYGRFNKVSSAWLWS